MLLQIVMRQLRLLLKGWDRVASLTTLAYRLEGHEPSLSYDRHPKLMENISAFFEVYAEEHFVEFVRSDMIKFFCSDLEVGLWRLTQWEQLCFEESGRQLLT